MIWKIKYIEDIPQLEIKEGGGTTWKCALIMIENECFAIHPKYTKLFWRGKLTFDQIVDIIIEDNLN